MVNPVLPTSNNSSPENLPSPLTRQEIGQKISSVNEKQIGLIAQKMVEKFSKKFDLKTEVEFVKKVKGTFENDLTHDIQYAQWSALMIAGHIYSYSTILNTLEWNRYAMMHENAHTSLASTYRIKLNVDIEETVKASELVFVLKETENQAILSTESFTLAELT